MNRTPNNPQAARKPRLWRSRALFFAKFMVAAGFLCWLFLSGRLNLAPLADIQHWGYLYAAVIATVASMVLPVWRWIALLKAQELEITQTKALGMTWVGYFANLFLPGGVGGDVAKAYVACRNKPGAKTRAVSTVIMDCILGLHSLLTIGGVAGVMLLMTGCNPRIAALVWFLLLLLGVATVAIILMFWPATSGIVLKFLPQRFREAMGDSLALYRRARKKLPWIFLYSCLCTVFAVAAYILAAAALGEKFSYGPILAIPLVVLANSLPISPGGLGIGEAVGAQLFAEFGSPNGGLIILIIRLVVMAVSIPGALALLGRYKYREALHVGPAKPSPRQQDIADSGAEVIIVANPVSSPVANQ